MRIIGGGLGLLFIMKLTARYLLVLLAVVFCYRGVSAEVTSLVLPQSYADFAIAPQSGDLIALAAEKNQAEIFTAENLDAGKTEPVATIRVGSTPVSVFYKRYQDQEYFAVVCSQDSHLFLISAKAPYELVSKIQLSQSGVSLVTGSINPDDPFLYYCHGGGHDSVTGVVSLRDMKNQGVAFDDSMDCAITASGNTAYRRGPWSPSGFESLVLTNSLSDPKPEFGRLFYDHNSTAAYLPDPFDRFTAAGKSIYHRTLRKKEAELSFQPLLFLQSKPVVLGVDIPERSRSRSSRSEDKSVNVKLQAASYNTFSAIGDHVELSYEMTDEDTSLPRGVSSQADFKQVGKRTRLLADEPNSRVIYAQGNRLHYVPLADFNLPDEAFLLAELEGQDTIVVGRENKLTLKPKDDRVSVKFNDKPEGMEVDGQTLTWTPGTDQIGPVTLLVTLEQGDIQRAIPYELTVEYPHTKLPFEPSGVSVDQAGKRAVIWNGTPRTEFPLSRTETTSEPAELAVVNLETGQVEASRRLAEPAQEVLITEDALIVRTVGTGGSRCDILSMPDLERTKIVTANGPIQDMQIMDGKLFLTTNQSIEAYDLETFDRKLNLEPRNSMYNSMTEYGIYHQGVLLGYDLQPKIILDSGTLPTLGGRRNIDTSDFLDRTGRRGNNRQLFPTGNGTQQITIPVPGSSMSIKMDVKNERSQVPGATHTWQTVYEIALAVAGPLDARQVIVRKTLPAEASGGRSGESAPVLEVTSDAAYVVDGKNLYRWSLPQQSPDQEDSLLSKDAHWEKKQSALELSDGDTTVLEHKLLDAKQPVVYSMPVPFDGVTIDEKTGTVTVDNQKILSQAGDFLEQHFLSKARFEKSPSDVLREEAPQLIERATLLLGRRPTGVPMAIPIQLSASDANLATKNLTYFVVVEVPSREFMVRLNRAQAKPAEELTLDGARAMAAQAIAARAKARAAPKPQGEADRIAELTKKIEAMEQQMQLLTRQMNLMMQKLEQAE